MGTHVELLGRPTAVALPPAALAALPDVALARRVLGGEERPFEALYGRYKNPLYRYCAAFLRNAEDAEDALQGAMVNAFRALSHGVPGDLAVKPWLYRIAHRECLNIVRRRPAHEELTGVEEAPGAGVAERAEHAEEIRQLAADLGALAPRARHALLLRELAGLSYGDVAAAMEVAEPVARNLVYEARQALEEINEGRLLGCADVQRTISDGDGRALRGRRMTAHLRSCAGCRGYRDRIAKRSQVMAAMVPAGLPALASRRIFEAATGSVGTAGGGGAIGAGTTAAGAGAAAGSSAAAGTLGVKGLLVVVSALSAVAAPLAVERVEGARPAVVVRAAASAPAAALPPGVRVVVPQLPVAEPAAPGVLASAPQAAPSAVVEGASPADGHVVSPPADAVHKSAENADAGRAAPAVHRDPRPADTAPVVVAALTQIPPASPDALADSRAPSRMGAAQKAGTHAAQTARPATGAARQDARGPWQPGSQGKAVAKAAAPVQNGRQHDVVAVEESLPAVGSAQAAADAVAPAAGAPVTASVGQDGAPAEAGKGHEGPDTAPGLPTASGAATAAGGSVAAHQTAAVADPAGAQPAAEPLPAAPVAGPAGGGPQADGQGGKPAPPGQAAKTAG